MLSHACEIKFLTAFATVDTIFLIPFHTLAVTSLTLSQFAISNAIAPTIATITSTIGLAIKNANKLVSAGTTVAVTNPDIATNTPCSEPIAPIILPTPDTTLPTTVSTGPTTATIPSITAIAF